MPSAPRRYRQPIESDSPAMSGVQELSNPADLARATLKELLARRLPATPDNYTRVYVEIASPRQRAATVEQPGRTALGGGMLCNQLGGQLEIEPSAAGTTLNLLLPVSTYRSS